MRRVTGIVQPFAKENDYDGLYLTENDIDNFCQSCNGTPVFREHDMQFKGKCDIRTSAGKIVDARKDPITKSMIVDIDIDPTSPYGAEILVDMAKGHKMGLSMGIDHTIIKDPISKVIKKQLKEVSIVSDPAIIGSNITYIQPEPDHVTETKKMLNVLIELNKFKNDIYKSNDTNQNGKEPLTYTSRFSASLMTSPIEDPKTSSGISTPANSTPQKRSADQNEPEKRSTEKSQKVDSTESTSLENHEAHEILKNPELFKKYKEAYENERKKQEESLKEKDDAIIKQMDTFIEWISNKPNLAEDVKVLLKNLSENTKIAPRDHEPISRLVSTVAHIGKYMDAEHQKSIKEGETWYQKAKEEENKKLEAEKLLKEERGERSRQQQKKNDLLDIVSPSTSFKSSFDSRWDISAPPSQAQPTSQSKRESTPSTSNTSFSGSFSAPKFDVPISKSYRRDPKFFPPELQRQYNDYNANPTKGFDRVPFTKGLSGLMIPQDEE